MVAEKNAYMCETSVQRILNRKSGIQKQRISDMWTTKLNHPNRYLANASELQKLNRDCRLVLGGMTMTGTFA